MFKPMMVSVYWSFCCEFALKEEIITKKIFMCNGVCKWLVHHMPSIFVRNKIPCNLNFILGICSIYYFIQQLDNFVYLNTFAEWNLSIFLHSKISISPNLWDLRYFIVIKHVVVFFWINTHLLYNKIIHTNHSQFGKFPGYLYTC